MNRQIFFRGKRLDNGEWVYGDLEYNRAKNIARIHTYDEDGEYLMQHLVEPGSMGQFTGMTDKNGKEIFEHDVVRYYDDIEDELVNSHVIYHKESCYFCVAPTELCGDYIGLTAHWQYEVIGNIHDDPTLISDKQ